MQYPVHRCSRAMFRLFSVSVEKPTSLRLTLVGNKIGLMHLLGHSFMWIYHVLPSMLVSTPTMSKISKSSYLIPSSLDATGSRFFFFFFSLFEPEDSTTSALDAKIYFKSMSFLDSLFNVLVSNLSVLTP